MDEFELLIGILVGLFKLVRWIFKTLFRGIGGIVGVGRRALRAPTGKRAEPPRMTRASPKPAPRPRARPAPAASAPRASDAYALDPSSDDYVPPPPPSSYSTARQPVRPSRPEPREREPRDGDWLSPAMVRDALVLDAIFRRRR